MKISLAEKLRLVFSRIGWKFVVGRLISSLISLIVIITIIFFMIRLVPGGPFSREKNVPEIIIRNLEKKYHMDEPLGLQYLRYMGDIIFRFDFGPSFKYKAYTVNELVAIKFPVSFTIGFFAILISFIVGTVAGIISALRQNKFSDYFVMSFAMLGISTPLFVIAPLLILLLASTFGLVPVAGWGTWKHAVIPVLTLSLPYTSYVARLTKSGMLDNIRKDFVVTARSKGLSENAILFKHVLKGSIIPVVTFLGPAFAGIVTGSTVVEQICGIPGIGRDFVQAAFNRDYTLTAGVMITFSTLLIAMNFLVDLLYAFLDPRTKYN